MSLGVGFSYDEVYDLCQQVVGSVGGAGTKETWMLFPQELCKIQFKHEIRII